MFDNFCVHKQVLDDILRDEWKAHITQDDQYYLFQTKDLENALFSYYIESDYELLTETFEWDNSDHKVKKQSRRNEPLTQCVSFYDVFETNTHQVMLTLYAKIIDGNMHEVSIKSVEQTCLKEIQARNERNARKWDHQESTWEMRVFRCMQSIEWKINRLLYPIAKKWHGIMQSLRLQAEAKTEKYLSINK